MGRYSYRLQPGATLAANLAGLDPLTAPHSFNHSLRRDLEALFVPQHTHQKSQQHASAQEPLGAIYADSAVPATESKDGAESKEAVSPLPEEAGTAGQSTPHANRDLPATALSDRIMSSIVPLHRQRAGNAVPDLRSLHRSMPSLDSSTRGGSEGSHKTDGELPLLR